MAKTPEVQVVAALPRELSKSLDNLTVSLKAVEKQMLANAQSASALERAFGSNKNFAAFVKNLEALSKVNLANFKVVTRAISELTSVTKELNQIQLNDLSLRLKEVVETVNSFAKVNVEGITSVGLQLQNAISVLSGAKLGKGTETAISSLRGFINAYIKLSSATIDSAKTNNLLFGKDGIFANIRRLFTEFKELPLGNDALTKRASASINAISEVIRAYISIVNLINDATKETPTVKIPATKQIFDFVIPFINDVIGKFALIDTSKLKNVESLKTVIGSIRNILDIISGLGNLKLPDLSKVGLFKTFDFGQLDAVYELIYQMITKLSLLGRAVDKADPRGLDAIERIASIIPSIIGALKSLKDLPELIDAFKTTSNIFGKAGDLAGIKVERINQIGALEPIFQVISKISTRLAAIGGKVAKANPAGFDALGSLAEALPKILNTIPKLQKAIELIPDFRGEVLLNRLRKFAKLDQVFALVKYLAGQMAKIAGHISKVNPEGFAALTPMAEAIGRITSAIPKLLDASERLDSGVFALLKRRFITIPRFLGVFGDAARQLSQIAGKIKNIAGISSLVGIIKDVIEITTAVTAQGGGTQSVVIPKLTGLPAFFKDVAAAANELQGIKASDQRLTAVAGIAAAGKAVDGLADEVQQSSGTISHYLGIIGDAFVSEFGKNIFEYVKKSITQITNFKEILGTSLRSAGDQLKQFGQSITSVGQNLVNNFGIGKLVGSTGAQLAVQFDDIQKQIEVFASDIGGSTKQIADFANEIGIKYPLSANEALQATLDLAKAGQKFGNIQQILPSAADLAALSDTKDLKAATNFLIQAAGGFKQFTADTLGGFQNISTASDIVFNVANNTTASIEGLYEGLKESTAAANGFGLTLDEAAVTLGTFEDAGKRGTEAGRLLRTVLTGLSNEKGRNELTRLGVAFQNQNGEIRSLGDIVDDLRVKYKELGYSEVDLLKSTSEFGDENARTGLKILLNSKSTNQSLGELSGAIANGSTAAAGMQKILTSLSGKFSQLQGSIETLNVKAFLPMINRFFAPFVELATNAINLFLTLDDSVIETTATMLALGAAIASVVGVGLILVGGLTTLAGGFVSLAGTVLLVTTNLPLVATILSGIAATIAIALPLILALAGAFAYVSSIITEFFRQIEDRGSTIGKSFSFLKETIGTVVEQLRRLFTIAKTAYDITIGKLFGAESQRRLGIINTAIVALTDKFKKLRDYLAGLTETDVLTFFFKLETAVRPVLEAISKIGGGLFDILTGNFDTGSKKIQFGISGILQSFTELIQKLTGGDFERAIARFSSGKIVAGIRDFVREFAQLVKNAIFQNKDKFEEIGRFVLDFFNPFKKASTLLSLIGADDVAGFIGGIGDKINDAIIGVFDTIARVAGGQSLGDAVFANFGQLGKDVVGVLQAFGNVLNTVIGIVRTFVGLFFPVFGSDDASKNIQKFGEILDKVLQGIASTVNILNDQVLKPLAEQLPFILNGITTFIGKILTDLAPAVDIIKDAAAGFGLFLDNVRKLLTGEINPGEFINNIVANFIAGIEQIPARIGATIVNIGKTIGSDFVQSIGDALGKGDLLGAGGIILNRLASIFLDVVQRIPDFILNLGRTLNSGFLKGIGLALKQGDIIRAAKILGEQIVNLVRSAVEFAFNSLVNIFDDFLDRFDNRFVGALVLVLGGIGTTILGFLIVNLPAIVATAAGALIAVGNSIASFISFGFVSGLSGGFLLAAAAVVGVLGTLVYTVFNDPDLQDQAKGFGGKTVASITGGITEQTPALQRAIEEAFAGAFDRIGNVAKVGELIEGVADQLKEAIQGAVENVFGEGLIANSISNIVALPIRTIGNLVQGVAAVLNFTVQRIVQIYDFARRILEAAYTAVKPLLDGIANIIRILDTVYHTFIAGLANAVSVILPVLAGVAIAITAVTAGLLYLPGLFSSTSKSVSELGVVTQQSANAMTELNLSNKLTQQSLLEVEYAAEGAKVGLDGLSASLREEAATANAQISSFGKLGEKLTGFGKTAAKFALQAAAIAVFTQALSSLGKALEATFKQNLLQGILTFFQDFTTGLLRLVGLEDVANKINETFEQIKFLAEFYGKDIERTISGVLAGLINTLNDVRNRVGQLQADAVGAYNAVSQQYFKLADILNNAGEQSADNFFKSFATALSSGADPGATKIQLQAYAGTVSSKFAEYTADGLSEAFAANTPLFSYAVTTMVAAGQSDEVVSQVKDVADFLALSALQAGEDAIKNSSDQTRKNLIASINESLNSGDVSDFDLAKLGGEFADAINSGIIKQTPEALALLDRLNLTMLDGKAVAKSYATEIVNTNYDLETFMDTARDTAIDEFNKKVVEGAGDVDKYAEALQGLNDAMEVTLDAEKRRRFAELNKQLKDGPEAGGVSIQEYKVEAQDLIDEIYKKGVDDVADARSRLTDSLSQGLITSDVFEKQGKELDDYIAKLDRQKAIDTKSIELQVRLNDKTLSPDQFTVELQKFITEFDSAKQKAAQGDTGTGTTDGGTIDFSAPPVVDAEADTAKVEKAQADSEEIVKIKEDTQKKVDDINEKISDLDRDFLQNKTEEEQKYAQDSERQQQDHNEKMLELQQNGTEQIQDAVASRDSAAAQSAVKNRKKGLTDEEANYKKAQERRAIDFGQQQAEDLQKYNQKRADFQNDLAVTRNEGQQKLAEAQKAANGLVAIESKAGNTRQQIASQLANNLGGIFKGFADNAVNIMNRINPGLTAAIGNTVNGVVNFANQLLTGIHAPAGNPIQNAASTIGSSLSGIGGIFSNALGNIGNVLNHALPPTTNNALAGGPTSANSGNVISNIFTNLFGGHAAKGADAKRGKVYEVNENKVPELYNTPGGRQYVLATTDGKIVPPTVGHGTAAGGGDMYLTVDLSNMSFAGVDGNPEAIATMVEKRVISGVQELFSRAGKGKR